jgi:3-hydroxyisobutyrate dehydrogenase-like beta-hydroxyacid dehydrogenase
MGRDLAHSLLRNGHLLTVFNRTAAASLPFAAMGVDVSDSAATAAQSAEVVISCVFDDRSARDVGTVIAANLAPGGVHIGATTISPTCSAELAELHRLAGRSYVAGPVVGRPDAAAEGRLISFLAGDPDAIDRARPVVSAYAQTVGAVGPRHADASSIKLAINYSIAGLLGLMGEAYQFLDKSGVAPQFLAGFYQSAFAAAPLKHYADRIAAQQFPSSGGFAATAGLKDLSLMQQAFMTAGAKFGIGAIVAGKLAALVRQGDAALDWSAIARYPTA